MNEPEKLNGEVPDIFVATPTHHMMPGHINSMERFRDACARLGIQLGIYRETGDGVVRARNRAVARFLTTKSTHLFFIDDDIGFNVDDALVLIGSGIPVVCGVYPKKELDWSAVAQAVRDGVPDDKLVEHASPLCFSRGGESNQAKVLVDGNSGRRFVCIYDAPTGFMCIRREVIEKMIAHYGDSIAYKADYEECQGKKHHAIFHMDRDPINDSPESRYLSEDYWFCRQWQRMGGEVFAFAECRLQHYGTFTYDGCMANLLKPMPQVPTGEVVQAPEEAAAQ